MIVHERLEDFLIKKIKDATGDTFKEIIRGAPEDMNLERISEYVKRLPLCTVGCFDEDVLSDESNSGEIQMLDFTVRVHIVIENKWNHEKRADEAKTAHRAIKAALRGLPYLNSDGNTEPSCGGLLYYRGVSILQDNGGIQVLQQRYAYRQLESNPVTEDE